MLFLLTLIILPLSWILDPLKIYIGPMHLSVGWGLKPLLAPVAILSVRLILMTLARQSGMGHNGLLGIAPVRKVVLAVISVYTVVGLMEWSLALMDFRIQMAPIVIAMADEDGKVTQNEGFSDPELRWKLPKGEDYYGMRVNSLGYRDREIRAQKDQGTVRVISMGDSCTAHGSPPYSYLLHDLLNTSPPTESSWQAFNMACYGYSSVQGLKVFRTQTKDLEPDIVTLYFGWNDHWLEMKTDRNVMAVKTGPVYGRIYNLFKEKRLFMLTVKLGCEGRHSDAVRTERGFRVPPEEYRSVISELIAEIRSTGAYPVVITAPRRNANKDQDKYGSDIDYNDVHDLYVDITRSVALSTGSDLLDLYLLLEDPKFDECFQGDGIHLNQSGLQLVAKELDIKLREMVQTLNIGGS